jgi:hypothetical protein
MIMVLSHGWFLFSVELLLLVCERSKLLICCLVCMVHCNRLFILPEGVGLLDLLGEGSLL